MLKSILILSLGLLSCQGDRNDHKGFPNFENLFPGFKLPEIQRNARSFEEQPVREGKSFEDLPNIGFGQFDMNGQGFGPHQGQFQNREEFRSETGGEGQRESRHGGYDIGCGNGCGGGYGNFFNGMYGGGGGGCSQIVQVVQYLYVM